MEKCKEIITRLLRENHITPEESIHLMEVLFSRQSPGFPPPTTNLPPDRDNGDVPWLPKIYC